MTPRQFDPNTPEWMDLEQPESPELQRDLDNLRTLNRLFGSHTLILRYLARWLTPGRTWTLLDLATGSGDIPREIVKWTHSRGIPVRIDAVDRQSSTLAVARRQSGAFPEISFHEGDIRTFGSGGAWDVVLCSLALHHFSESDAVAILERIATLATTHSLVSDLRRCAAGTLGVGLLTSVWMREPMTRHDARASVRRAFSFAEFAALARAAGWKTFTHRRHFCFRQALALDK